MIKLLFILILILLFVYIAYKYRDPSKILFFLLIFTATLRLGYIFYRYNGILLLDFVIITLLVIENARYKNFTFLVPKIWIVFFLFIGWSVFSTLTLDWMQANSFAEISKYIRAYLILVAVYNFITWKKDLNLFIDALFITILYHGLVSIYQWRAGPIGLTFLGEIPVYSYRSYGLFQHPNFLGDYLAFSIPLMVRFFYFDRSKKKLLYYGAILGISLLSIFTTFSRGAWVGLLAALGCMFVIDIFTMNFRKIKSFSLVVSVVFLTLFFIRYSSTIQDRFMKDIGMEGGSAQIRIPLMKIATQMIADRPFFGVGYSNYELYAQDYAFQVGVFSEKTMSQIVHNSYLLMAAEIGLPGLFIYLSMIIIVLNMAIRNYKSKNTLIKNTSTGILWGIIAVLIAFLAGPDYMIHEVLNMFWLLSGITIALYFLNLQLNKYITVQKYKQKNLEFVN